MKYLLDTNIVSYFLRDASPGLSQHILDSTPDALAISIFNRAIHQKKRFV